MPPDGASVLARTQTSGLFPTKICKSFRKIDRLPNLPQPLFAKEGGKLRQRPTPR